MFTAGQLARLKQWHPNVEDESLLRRTLPTTYDEAEANELEATVSRASKRVTEIQILASDDAQWDAIPSNTRYLDVVLSALERSVKEGWTLEKLEIGSYFKLNRAQLDSLIWVAPRELELTIGAHAEPEEWNLALPDRDWSQCCHLQKFSLRDGSELNDDAYVALLQSLAKITTLESLSLAGHDEKMRDPYVYMYWDFWLFDEEKLTGPLVTVLQNNPRIKDLYLDYVLPTAAPFCHRLQSCKHLKSLHLERLDTKEENLEFFEHLAKALSCRNVIVDELHYEGSDGGDKSAWGPSGVMFPVFLNRTGHRQRMMDESLSSQELVGLLLPLRDRTPAEKVEIAATQERLKKEAIGQLQGSLQKPSNNNDLFGRAMIQMALHGLQNTEDSPFGCPFAINIDLEDLKNLSVLYSLLSQSPAIWLRKLAAETALNDSDSGTTQRHECDSKPQARKRAGCQNSNHKPTSSKKAKTSNTGA